MFCNKFVTDGKAVLITGCDSGFGNQLAFKLNELGFKVYATVLSKNSPGSINLITNSKFANIMCVLEMDVTRDEQIDGCFHFIQQDLQQCDCVLWSVVNNSGVVSFGHLEWGTFDEYRRVFDINLFGVVRVTRRFIPLVRQSRGRIVIVASTAGRVVWDNNTIYCMSKCAAIAFADGLRREMRKFKIKISTIEPGLFLTGIEQKLLPEFKRNWQQTSPDIQQIYGNQYFAKQLKLWEQYLNRSIKMPGVNKLSTCVNNMVSAIVDRNPKVYYQTYPNIIERITTRCFILMPNCIIDRTSYMMGSTKPDFMINK